MLRVCVGREVVRVCKEGDWEIETKSTAPSIWFAALDPSVGWIQYQGYTCLSKWNSMETIKDPS